MDVLRTLRDCVYEWDFVADTATFSEELLEVFGYPERSVVGAFRWWMDRIHPEDRGRTDAGATIALRMRQERCSLEYRFRRADGGWTIVLDRVRVFYDADGKPLRCVGTLSDVTDVRRMESQIQRAQKLESIGRLAGGVAHDFNNLLTAILGSANLLKGGLPERDPFHREIEVILSAVRRAESLTRQLLALSRNRPVESGVVDLNRVIRGMEGILRRLIGEGIEIVTSLAPDLHCVGTDSSRIEQVILNLAVNARDAMPGGGRLVIATANETLDSIEADARVRACPGPHAIISVTDTGCGMDEAVLGHLFEPFFTTKPDGKGTGLGLATVYGIVTQARGHVAVRSEPGRGTTITVHLPAVEGTARQAPSREVVPVPVVGPATVLVVEDDDSVRGVLLRSLQAHGFRVLGAGGGEEALAVADSYDGTIHALLTDVVMPVMSGPVLAERLLGRRPGLGVLFMSGYRDWAAGNGPPRAAFISKPFEMDDLVARLAAAIQASAPCAVSPTRPPA